MPVDTRTLGLIGGGGALLVALGVATLSGPDKTAPDKPAPPAVVQAKPSVSATAPVPQTPDVETAMVDPPPSRPVAIPKTPPRLPTADAPVENPDLEFIVRFDSRHPLSVAQGLYLQGKRADAEAEAQRIMAQRAELAGLCFRRFTLGAEIVMAHCAPVSRAQAQRVSDRWVRKLRAVKGVQYVDANVVLQAERK
jgi:type IV secretory pathway VirB10-like protein